MGKIEIDEQGASYTKVKHKVKTMREREKDTFGHHKQRVKDSQ